MSLLVYAITDGSPADAVGAGLADRPLRAVGEAGLVALVSEHEEPPEPTEATLWAFEQVIETQMLDQAVLPARFGTLVEDAHRLEDILRGRRQELSGKFERIRGAVELGVRASWPVIETQTPPAGPESGTSYMLERVERANRARELATRIDLELGGLARAARYRVFARPTVPVTAAYLVDSVRTEQFVSRVRDLEAAIEDTDIVCTGPWPPYSFVGSESDD